MYICRIKILILIKQKRIMKKLLVIAVAILSFSAVNAQVAYVGFQSVTGKSKVGDTTTSKTSSGFVLGGAMNFGISDGIGVQPGLEIAYASRSERILTIDHKYPSLGVRIPIDVNYGFELSPDFKLYAYAGPSIYFGLSFKDKFDDTTVDKYENSLNRFGLGLGVGAWCDVKDMIRVKVGYDMGLINRAQDSDWNYKENAFLISVGYLF